MPRDSPAPDASGASEPASLRFGDFELQPRQRRLLRQGQPVRIGVPTFNLLSVLVRHADELLDADTLRRAVWPEQTVAPNNLRVQLTLLRRLLGPDAIEHQVGRGWRLALSIDDPDRAGAGAVIAGARGAAAPPSPAPRGNLPARLPPLLGRSSELAELLVMLGGQVRVSLVGPAGVGKTTLSLAAAAARQASGEVGCGHGVWQVDLTAVTEAAQVLTAVATVLDLHLPPEAPMHSLVRSLSTRRLLLLLDNCEHLVDPVRALCDDLLRGAPGVAILATSRQPLHAAGEQIVRLAPLQLPATSDLATARRSGAVALFEAHGRRADARFELTAGNVAAVVDICRQLDGLPFAIVLAAARLPLLGVSGLHHALCTSDQGPLQVLRQPGAEATGRHHTLQAALDWSHALLTPLEQAVLRRMGVFAGSFALDAVLAVCADDDVGPPQVLEAIEALIHHSLLTVAPQALLDARTAPRYSMHLSVRVYARARLDAHDEADVLYRRHALHYAGVAEGLETGPGPHRTLRDAALPDADHDNLRRAIEWAIGHDSGLAVRLVGAGARFWRLRGHHAEALRLGERVLALAPLPGDEALAMRNKARMGVCGSAYEHGRIGLLETYALESVADYRRLGMPRGVSQALFWLATARHCQGHTQAGLDTYIESAAAGQEAGDSESVAHALINVGRLSIDLERWDEGRAALLDALSRYRALGAAGAATIAHHNLGDVAYAQGDLAEAEAQWLIAIAGYRADDHRWPLATVLLQMGCLLADLGRLAEAHQSIGESLGFSRRCGFEDLLAQGLSALAWATLAEPQAPGGGPPALAQAHRAAVLLGAAEQLRRRLGLQPAGLARRVDNRARQMASQQLGDAAWRAALSQGARLTPEQALVLRAEVPAP